jgi:mono/diheme cytochrome c family protein
MDLLRSMDLHISLRIIPRIQMGPLAWTGRGAAGSPRRDRWVGIFASLALLVPAGCDKAPPKEAVPSFQELRASRPWVTASSLEQGGRLHREHCLTCHGQAPRELYSPDRWREIVGAMAERSRLDTSQSRMVLDWILVGDSLAEGSSGK